MANKNSYHAETWKLLDTLKEIAPGPELADITSNELLDIAGVDESTSNRNWFVYDLRRRGLAESQSPVNSGKRVKAIRLTNVGHDLIKIYKTEGEPAAVAKLPAIIGRETRPKAATTRNQALVEARSTLGPDAPIGDVIKVAQFLLGE